MRNLLMAICFAGAFAGTAANEAPLLADDPALEARVMSIAQELRCLVCQNETVAASHADLAVDLRQQIRTQLKRGRSPQQVSDFMVERYGEFVLYRPRFNARTLLLWLGPFALLLVAILTLVVNVRRRRTGAPDTDLSAPETSRARRLLGIVEETRS
ncbi:MAG: cytochrome c-type biogenesis protein [Burkholderiaceae bacterium]